MKLLTNLLFEPKGKHNSALSYNIKDTVMSADGSRVYFALQNVPAGIALTNEDYWMLQMDISSSKSAMDEALASFGNYAKSIGMRVKGETAKASGNPVSFLPDAGSLLQPVTVLEPKQAGSGDPYPAGCGRNKLVPKVHSGTQRGLEFTQNADGSWTVKGTTTAANTFLNLNYVNATTSLLPPGEYIVSGGSADVRVQIMLDNYVTWQSDGNHVRFTIPNGVTNSWVRLQVESAGVTVDRTVYPMVRLATDSDESYAPPSNIRPITGYDKLGLNAAGKNLLNPSILDDIYVGYTSNGSDGSIIVNNTSTATVYPKTVWTNLPAGTYTISYTYSGSPVPCYLQQNADDYTLNLTSARYKTITLTKPGQVRLHFVANASYAINATVQLELGSIATTFQPYIAPTPYTVQIGQTVYGGRMDWLTGKLLVTHLSITFNGTESWRMDSSGIWVGENGNSFYTDIDGDGIETSKENTYVFCNSFRSVTRYESGGSGPSTWTQNCVCIAAGGSQIEFIRTSYNSIDAWKAFVADMCAAGTPIQAVCELATPIEIGPFTPHIISAVEPEQNNTLYGDGSIEVEYVKPLHVSIEERVAAAMAAMHIE